MTYMVAHKKAEKPATELEFSRGLSVYYVLYYISSMASSKISTIDT